MNVEPEGGFRTEVEREARKRIARLFTGCTDGIETRLDNFTKYISRQNATRFLALYEIFKLVLSTKGSVIECGVHRGFGLMAWAQLSAVLEPVNITRRIYGFDTFEGFPSTDEKDRGKYGQAETGTFDAEAYDELVNLIGAYDDNRFLGHISKIELIKGDAVKTIPEFIAIHQHLVVSLLFLDFDLYEPTKVALENFLPRMPKGSIIAFDELDNPLWPGETRALLETIGINALKIKRIDFDPYIGYAVI